MVEDDQQTIVYKYPAFNQAIQDSSKLVVRTGQSAIFQAEGKFPVHSVLVPMIQF